MKIDIYLIKPLKERLVECLYQNFNLFAWIAADMPGIDPKVACHRLSILLGFKPVAQKTEENRPRKAVSYR